MLATWVRELDEAHKTLDRLRPMLGARFARRLRPMGQPKHGFGRGRRRGARRERGHQFARW